MKTGVFLARMQPLHNGHFEVIKFMAERNEKVVIFIGSNDKELTKRNPLPGDLRKQILERVIDDELADYKDKIEIHLLNDWTHENDFDALNEWGLYLYYNIVSRAGKEFSIYFSDNPQIMLSWFDNYMRDRIRFTFLEREEIADGISATKIRKAMKEDNLDFVAANVPRAVIGFTEVIKKHLVD